MKTVKLRLCSSKYWSIIGIGLLLIASPIALAVVSVSISPAGGFNITPGVAVIDQSVGTITLDADQSYNVTLKDDTNGLLVNGANNMAYTVKYNGAANITLSTSPTNVESAASVTSGNRSLTVSVSAGASIGIPAGPYNATITVEILAI
jgi:hypothetical protein